jgi:hypothetical protein
MLETSDNKEAGGTEEEKQPDFRPAPGLGKSQKIAVASLAVFALFIMVMWTIQFKKGLSDPFVYKGPDASDNSGAAACSGPDCPAVQEAQKKKDTDQDGLSDYDENYIHKTSAYLEDSDSDGISDKKEIDANKDPNCPEGKECSSAPLVSEDDAGGGSGSSAGDLSSQFQSLNSGGGQTGLSAQATTTNQQVLENFTSGDIDAASLRQMLLENGVPKDVLNKISDEELLKSFGEVVSGM